MCVESEILCKVMMSCTKHSKHTLICVCCAEKTVHRGHLSLVIYHKKLTMFCAIFRECDFICVFSVQMWEHKLCSSRRVQSMWGSQRRCVCVCVCVKASK